MPGRRREAGFALALTALKVALSLVLATTATAAAAIKSGAGPGWPATIAPSEFVARVTNPWFPLLPGSVWHYTGVKEGERMEDSVRVTDRSKRILGVAVTVVHDVVTVRGKAEEVTDDFYAQDRRGDVWYFGEETRELSPQGKTTSTEGSFEAGVGGARPGVLMPGHPRVGQVGRQELLKGEAEDRFRVLDLSAPVSVPFVSSHGALRTREWTPLEPGVIDNKFYVRGVGNVREETVRGPVETLSLVSFRTRRGSGR